MSKQTLTEQAADKCAKKAIYDTAYDDTYHGFIQGAKWQQEQHKTLHNSIREIREDLRDRFEVADFREGGHLKEQIRGVDMVLDKFDQFNEKL